VTVGSPRYYTVGFVVPERPVVRSLGSGTLVTFGTLHGILTARHVADKLHVKKENGLTEIGLARVTRPDAQPQGARIPLDWIDDVKIGKEPNNEFGPDLAFIRLPDQVAANLKANSSFLNLLQESQLSKSAAPAGTKQRDLIYGVVAEWSKDEPDPTKQLDMGLISVLVNEGHVIEIATHDGCDRLKFTPLPDQELIPALPDDMLSPPTSYGGTSGGGLWRLYAEPTADGKERLVQSRLLGVAYHETDRTNRWRNKIICHGPQSVYRTLPERIRSRWSLGIGTS
jgi:hypothetical protein